MLRKTLLGVFALTVMGLLGGCVQTEVVKDHPALFTKERGKYASVYFLRPRTERYMGFADNRLDVDVGGKTLLSLVKGEYTLVKLKPRLTEITLRNLSSIGPKWDTTEMKRTQKLDFTAGGVFYVVLKPIDGEFRGVHFVAQTVDRSEAKKMADDLIDTGAAKITPIAAL